MIHSIITSSIIERGHRSPFLGAVYEAVLSWYILLPTTVALFAPNYGKFNVTSKGGTVKENSSTGTSSNRTAFLLHSMPPGLFSVPGSCSGRLTRNI